MQSYHAGETRDAWRAGCDAFGTGGTNPYAAETDNYAAWNEGFDIGKSIAREREQYRAGLEKRQRKAKKSGSRTQQIDVAYETVHQGGEPGGVGPRPGDLPLTEWLPQVVAAVPDATDAEVIATLCKLGRRIETVPARAGVHEDEDAFVLQIELHHDYAITLSFYQDGFVKVALWWRCRRYARKLQGMGRERNQKASGRRRRSSYR
jgi:hypothetical protein